MCTRVLRGLVHFQWTQQTSSTLMSIGVMCKWHLLDAHLTKTHEPQDAKVAVKEAGLVRKHSPCRIASKDDICERREPVPEVSDCIDVVQVFTDMRSVLPKLLLSHCSFDGSILQMLMGGGGGGEICCQGGGAEVYLKWKMGKMHGTHSRTHTSLGRPVR